MWKWIVQGAMVAGSLVKWDRKHTEKLVDVGTDVLSDVVRQTVEARVTAPVVAKLEPGNLRPTHTPNVHGGGRSRGRF